MKKNVSQTETSSDPFLYMRIMDSYFILTRIMNIIIALGLLICLSPFMALLILLIWIFDGRPIFYKGERIGKNGRIFVMYKFRTLNKGAEQKIGGRLMLDDEGHITILGHFLRCLKMDELPQLFNILRGDMNFVGPRPVRPLMAMDYGQICRNYWQRFSVKPGLTGLAQLRGGYYCPPKRKTRYDLFYIGKRTFLFDLKLFFLTAIKILFSPKCLKLGGRPIGMIKATLGIKRLQYKNNLPIKKPLVIYTIKKREIQ